MADLERFHNINFFISCTNLRLGFLLVDFSGFRISVLVLVLIDVPKWWLENQQNHEKQAGATDNGTCYEC